MVTCVTQDWRLMLASMKDAWSGLGEVSPGGRTIQRDGLIASLVPEVPERSVMNSVIYDDPDSLAASLEELADAYDEAGVVAWTVWVPEHDRETAELLAGSGHALDATPAAMVADPAQVKRPDPGELDLLPAATFAEVATLNDRAYGYSDEPFRRALGDAPTDGVHLYVASVDGEPAACVVAQDHHGTDCGIYWVATLPEARGRGLATALMREAVADGNDRGCLTSTLQATKAGQPVYEHVGYRSIGTLQMWERRKPAG
jgi:ribosomal protein S18 acetylase RimI-like enzyme